MERYIFYLFYLTLLVAFANGNHFYKPKPTPKPRPVKICPPPETIKPCVCRPIAAANDEHYAIYCSETKNDEDSVAFAYGNEVDRNCPDPAKISPCICQKSCHDCQSVIVCSDINNAEGLQEIFQKSEDISFPYTVFKNVNVQFFPASSLETKRYIHLSFVNSSLALLLNEKPPEASVLQQLILYNVRLQRGIQWEQFSSLHSLKSMIFSNTEIRKIEDDFGQFVPKQVEVIDFTNTKTRQISKHAFTPLRNVKTLTISKTSLKKIDKEAFPPRLTFLDLSNNKLQDLPDSFFSALPALTVLHLHKNNITSFTESVFGNLPKHLRYISVRDNPIKCDCSIKWVTVRARIPYIDGKCASPENMADKRIRHLKKDDFKPC